jgi:high affinity cGMP-specific 3',5'-cyclic phosphodiesterase 9
MLFTILKSPDTDIFKNVEASERKVLRAGIIKCILATDMGKHGEICGKFKEMCESFDWSNQDHRSYVRESEQYFTNLLILSF